MVACSCSVSTASTAGASWRCSSEEARASSELSEVSWLGLGLGLGFRVRVRVGVRVRVRVRDRFRVRV